MSIFPGNFKHRHALIILLSVLLLSCSGGKNNNLFDQTNQQDTTPPPSPSTRPGEGQRVILKSIDSSGTTSLVVVYENGGQVVTLDKGSPVFIRTSQDQRLLYQKSASSTFTVEHCGNYCYYETYTINHTIMHSILPDGTGKVLFSDVPADKFITIIFNSYPVVVPQGLKDEFVAISSNQRVIFTERLDTSFKLYSATTDATDKITLTALLDSAYAGNAATDGRVIYSYSGNLYSIHDDGTGNIQLTQSSYPEYFLYQSTDGTVFYARDTVWENGSRDLYRVNADGTGTQFVVSNICRSGESQCKITVYGETPGGRLAFTKNYMSSSSQLMREFYTIKMDGTESLNLLDTCAFNYISVCNISAITSTGRVIVTHDETDSTGNATDILSYNEDGTDIIPLSETQWKIDRFNGMTGTGKVLFSKEELTVGPNGKTYFDIYSIDETGNNLSEVSVNPGDDDHFEGISRSGNILLSRGEYKNFNQHPSLYIGAEDGSNMSLLSDKGVVSMDASTTNGRIIYSRYVDSTDPASDREVRSVLEDGSDDIVLSGYGHIESFLDIF